MAPTLTHAESRRLYSWWWDSHISPKNSKWLQDNLTDMNAKVKLMIKLIEPDADSFARRADMYYKQRPELMKLVEESYRAYRALAERYDHATGALRQAHRTMAEAFPNQVPFVLGDDSPSGTSGSESGPHSPEMLNQMRAMLEPDELQKDALGLSSTQLHDIKKNGAYSNKPDSRSSIQGLKVLFGSGEGEAEHTKFAEGRTRRSPNFHEEDRMSSDHAVHSREFRKHKEEEDRNSRSGVSGQHGKTQVMSENEILILKQALEKLEAEKEASLHQYQQSLERLSNLESKVFSAHEDAKGLNERASRAENEVQTLKHALSRLEDEKKAGVVNYLQCLERITDLETQISCSQEEAAGLNERASKAESEAQTLKEALSRLEAEHEAALLQYKLCLEKISEMETRISRAEEDARRHSERGDRAEAEVESLKQSIAKLNEGKEASAIQYQHCMETISNLEAKISRANEEARRLTDEIAMGVANLKSAEEHHLLLERTNQSLQAEVDTMMNKMGVQTQEISDKHEELENLRICIQEEQLRYMQAEDALTMLRNLHSKAQEEQRSLESELQTWVQMFKDLKLLNQDLEDELVHLKEKNNSLHEQNLSSTMSIQNFQDEVFCLKGAIAKLEEQVEFRVDQRNALQQEIYCLKEEINDLTGRHHGVIEQVESVGLKPDCLGLSVKTLQDENSQLKEISQKDSEEKASLIQKLNHMAQLSEKNAILENSLSDANVELEVLREKLKILEEAYQSLQIEKSTLVAEKSILVSQLGIVNENLEKLSEKNTLLENSLSDMNFELEGSRATSKSLEESYQSIDNERIDLISERDTLVIKLETIQQRLEELEKSHRELEEKHSSLEIEKESILHQVAELRTSLDLEKQEHASFVQSNEIRLTSLEDQMQILQEERRLRNKEFEEEQDRAAKVQFENFVLQRCILDIEEKNFSLATECQKHFETSKLSEKLIFELEQKNFEQQQKVKSLLNQVEELRQGIHQMLKSLHSDPDNQSQEISEDHEKLLQLVAKKIEDAERYLLKTEDEKQQLLFEKVVLLTLLQQLRMEASDLQSERNTLDREIMIRAKELLMLQSEKDELREMNRQLRSEASDRDQHVEVLKAEMENQYMKLSNLQGSCLVLQNEKSNLIKENRSLMKEFSDLKEEKCMQEEENSAILEEAMILSNLCLIFKNFGAEKTAELRALSEDVDCLHGVNGGLEKEITNMREGLEMVEAENLHLKESVEKLENELSSFKTATDLFNHQIGIGKELLSQKEMELSYAQQDLKSLEIENMELEKEILKLSEDNTTHLELYEAEAEALYDDRQISTTRAVIFEEKLYELKGACDSLEDERASQTGEIKQLKESMCVLEGENRGMKSEMATYLHDMFSLADTITSLEDHVLSRHRIPTGDNQQTEDAQSSKTPHHSSYQELSEDQHLIVTDRILDLQDLKARVKAVERAVLEMKELKKQEDNGKNWILVKDIPLDQASGSSSNDHRFAPPSRSRRESSRPSAEILESWETAEQGPSINLTVNKIRKLPSKCRPNSIRIEALEQKSELQAEKELVVDKLEISKRVTGEHQEGKKVKVLERLASDAQKLTNIHITVQDLMGKVEQTTKSERAKNMEYDMLEGQLQEVENAIMQLIDVNSKLTKRAEWGSLSPDRTSEMEIDENGNARKRVSEQARRMSEKIGRLQLEVQRIQFVLLKLDDENETKKTMAYDKRRVLLRDYLYGDRRSSRRLRKRDRFCACVRPSTKEDW